jgi:predicted amidohydrolase YtcJ
MLRCGLDELGTGPEHLERIGSYAREHPDDDWIVGGGWSMSAFPGGTPTASALDTVVSDRPVYLTNRDGHGAWVNTAALRLAGIDARTLDPADGRIERDADGTPSGTLHEGAMSLVSRLVPPTSTDELVRALLLAQERLLALGITGWQDAIVGEYKGEADPAVAYVAADEAGTLVARVGGALWWRRDLGTEQIPDLLARREKLHTGRFSASSVKIMQDGVAENFTARMTSPYCDRHGHPTDNSGISFVAAEVLNEAAPLLDELGFQLHFHAIGDGAVRQCLDAVEHALRRNGRRDARHHIAHLQVVHPDDVPRFRELGVVANMQMYWATYEPQMVELTLPFLGEPRSSWQYPFGDLLRAGATLAAGSDWSVTTPDPWAAIHVGVNRVPPPGPGHEQAVPGYGAFLPEQRLDLGTALTAYTAGSAYVNHLDDAGVIRNGALADLVVLDRDPFAGPPQEIGATKVAQTFVDGRRVHAAKDA